MQTRKIKSVNKIEAFYNFMFSSLNCFFLNRKTVYRIWHLISHCHENVEISQRIQMKRMIKGEKTKV